MAQTETALVQSTRSDLEHQLTREWLLTNGRGGFASGTAVGINTRRYHGLLVAAARPPLERWMLLSSVLEKVTIDGRSVELASFQFDGAIHPQGCKYLTGFEASNNPQEPWTQFVYKLADFWVTKRVVLPRGQDEVRISYRIEAKSKGEVVLDLLPLAAMRDFHHLTQRFEGGFAVDPCKAAAIVHAWRGGPRLWLGGRDETSDEVMRFELRPDWWNGFLYREEAHRGQDCREDLFAPGWFRISGCGGVRCVFVGRALFGADGPEGESGRGGEAENRTEPETPALSSSVHASGGDNVGGDITHQTPPSPPLARGGDINVVRGGDINMRRGDVNVSGGDVERRLLDAADAFVVARRRGDGRESKTILAGYHWFGDWGRDTFIAMPGLLFETGRFDEAREILETFASVQRNGLIPNRFTDYGDGCDYNSVDASLWYLYAATRYFELTEDRERWAGTLYPACRAIVEHFQRGTEFDIRVASDGLVTAGNPTTQLTWMDAKFGDTVFTPRHGKAVEINALWYHGLRMLEKLCLQNSPEDAGKYDKLADKVEASFLASFWNTHAKHLYDVVRAQPVASTQSPPSPRGATGGSELADAAIRPNQIFAVSLPFTPLGPAHQQFVLDCVREHLLTPYGLRSLSPKDPAYKPRCEGNPFERDSAYHQGTVWGWLIGPYVEAYLRVNGFSAEAKGEMRTQLAALVAHLDEAGIGSVSEIFDGDPPHTPRGCIAQAWSVAELLRAWRMTA